MSAQLTKIGGYEIVRRIGQGGMGAVYEGLHGSIGRRVAIKVLLPEYAHQPDVVRRFFNEAKAVNAINHPGVVQVSDVGTAEDGSLFLVMEFLEGQTLGERLSQHGGRLNQSDTVSIAWQLAGVLTAAHSKNIVHRDLKPGNVMLVPDMAGPDGERVKLLDFGIAKLGVEHLQDQDVKTRTGQILGTAAYMSPEQFMGNRAIDAQTDVYSLGIMLFRMLAGRVPFTSTNGEMALGMMHLMEAPPPLAEQAPETSPWLVELVHRMLAKQPAERPTMERVLDELTQHLPFRPPSRSMPRQSSSALSALGQNLPVPPLASGAHGVAAAPAGVGVSTVPLVSAAPSSRSPAGGPSTITRANGQSGLRASLAGKRGWLVLGGLGAGLAVVLGLGVSLFHRSPPSQPASLTTAAGGDKLERGATPASANPPAAEKPAIGGPAVGGEKVSPAPPHPTTSGAATAPTGKSSGPAVVGSAKAAPKKKEEKIRRVPKAQATPLLD